MARLHKHTHTHTLANLVQVCSLTVSIPRVGESGHVMPLFQQFPLDTGTVWASVLLTVGRGDW